jgi:hypothetical protein
MLLVIHLCLKLKLCYNVLGATRYYAAVLQLEITLLSYMLMPAGTVLVYAIFPPFCSYADSYCYY